MLDFETCNAARLRRDPAFDGKFFTAARTTRIYCRPVCPVKHPLTKNVSYYPTGDRPLLRGVEGHSHHSRKSLEADRGWRTGYRHRGRTGGAAGRRDQASVPPVCGSCRRIAASDRPDTSDRSGKAATGRNDAADHWNRLQGGLWKRQTVQRGLLKVLWASTFLDP